MLPIDFNINGYNVKNIESNDLKKVLYCVNNSNDNDGLLGEYETFTIEDIELRYAETLINSLEFFCGIFYNCNIVGIMKGRIETKGISGEVWLISYFLLNQYRRKGIESQILNEFEAYAREKFNINNFNVIVMQRNQKVQDFWIKNGYKIKRITRGNICNDKMEISIYEKTIK